MGTGTPTLDLYDLIGLLLKLDLRDEDDFYHLLTPQEMFHQRGWFKDDWTVYQRGENGPAIVRVR